MKTRFGTIGILILILILVLTIGDVFLTYENLVNVYDINNSVNKTNKVTDELDRTLIGLLNSESGQRGFLITGDGAFLEPYKASLPTIDQHIKNIQQLTRGNSSIQKNSVLLAQKSKEIQTLFVQEINARKENGFNPAQASVADGTGRKKMNEIKKIITAMENEEYRLLAVRENQAVQSYRLLLGSSAFTGVLSILLIVITYYSINREFAKRSELEKNKDEFFNMASHELKTPITSLNIFIHVLLKKINANQKTQARRYVAKIEAQTQKLTALITDFLDLSRVQAGKMKYHKEEFNLDALIDETIDEIKDTTKKHKIVVKGSCKELVYADRYRIYQVLVNLITNAIKYSPDGGKITIICKGENNSAVVSISDQGIGIGEQHQDKIFDRLYQVSSNPDQEMYPGFGIGLFVSKEIVKYHEGKIWVTSNKGKGSTFSFSLPLK